MTWLGLRHKGAEVLYPEEWNKVVDGLDILYGYVSNSVKFSDLPKLSSDVGPSTDNTYDLGKENRAWRDIYAHYGYFLDNAYVQGKQVLKDGDPVITKDFIDNAKTAIDNIYNFVVNNNEALTKKPSILETWELIVGTSPVPLSSISELVHKIHIKIPSNTPYLIYVGNSTSQNFILEPKDILELEIRDPSKVYVKSLGNVRIFVAVEK